MNLKIGCVRYLNSRPFAEGLKDYSLIFEVPSKLAIMLREQAIDIGLIPVFEYLSMREQYDLIPGTGIACHGPVQSVFLKHAKKDLSEVRTISLDSSSLTGAHLLKVLCAQVWNIKPTFISEKETADAQFWIGDRALEIKRQHPQDTYLDLGETWKNWTDLPFVFAVWAARKGLAQDSLKQFQQRCLESIANPARVAQTPEEEFYITQSIHYSLSNEEMTGLERFSRELQSLGFISEQLHFAASSIY